MVTWGEWVTGWGVMVSGTCGVVVVPPRGSDVRVVLSWWVMVWVACEVVRVPPRGSDVRLVLGRLVMMWVACEVVVQVPPRGSGVILWEWLEVLCEGMVMVWAWVVCRMVQAPPEGRRRSHVCASLCLVVCVVCGRKPHCCGGGESPSCCCCRCCGLGGRRCCRCCFCYNFVANSSRCRCSCC